MLIGPIMLLAVVPALQLMFAHKEDEEPPEDDASEGPNSASDPRPGVDPEPAASG
jgi:hypothetical protein